MYRHECRTVSRRVQSASIAILALGAATANAADVAVYPTKPIRIIVGSSPGGSTDTVVRTIAPKMSEILGQQLVVDNRAGAAGNIAAQTVARANPDGYTLMATFATHVTNLAIMKNPGYDLERDFAPISLTVLLPNLMASHSSLPVKSVKELIALAAKNPDQIKYATGSYGGSTHLIVEDFLSMAKIKMFQVPYKGFGPAITGAISGEASVLFGAVLSVYPLTRDGRLRALGVTSAKRLSLLPDIPAIAETVPGYEAINWSGLSAPARTPAHIIKRLHATMVEALKDPTVAKRFIAQAADPAPSRSPDEFGAMIRSETRKWAKVAKDAGINAE
jgi:tripartite-type tricarboxylate transporter receptor subunit TctC